MANPLLVQQNTVATSASGPASITASLSGASTAGNFLLLAVTVKSNAADAAITTPAGWTLISKLASASGSVITALFALPNNAGGITTVAVTITNTAGGAVATMWEFSGMGTNPPAEFVDATTGVSDNATLPLARRFPPPATVGALWLIIIGYDINVSLTATNSQGFSAVVTGSSTLGTVNARMSSSFLLSLGPGGLENGGILSSASSFVQLCVRFAGTLGPIGYAAFGANEVALSGNNSPNGFGSWSVG